MPNAQRRIRFAKDSNESAADNESLNFAKLHTLCAYGLNAAYTFIPKNACSTMRFSIAKHNGYIDDISQIDWIHQNNLTLMASNDFLFQCDYTFVILRCPFRRLASVFLDRFVSGEMRVRKMRMLPFLFLSQSQNDVSFKKFVKLVARQSKNARDSMNAHWKHQVDFLYYETYDDYFSVENFQKAVDILENKGLSVIDTRNALKHDNSHFKKISGKYYNCNISQLSKLKMDGKIPDYSSMYDDELKNIVFDVYHDDFELYNKMLNGNDMLFSR